MSGAEANEASLWERWVTERDKAARDALILLHASWARLIARDIYLRLRPRDVEWGEFAQNATVGLIEATDRYDPSRGIEFRAFARHRVRGAVFNGLRQLWEHSRPPVRISDIDRAESLNEEGDPLDSFVSWAVGLGIGHLLDVAALPEPAPRRSSPYAELERDQTCELLRRAIELLPERERTILTWHYFQHVPFVEIANHLEVTKGRVSQLHKQAIGRLRACLQEFAESYTY